MSPRGALVLALAALILLGVWGLWMVNVPIWAAVAAGLVISAALGVLRRRLRSRRDREKTEA